MNRKQTNVRAMAILALMTALVVIFSFTPIGSIPVGPLVITLNTIPVAIAAIALGPRGGAVIGGVFGLLSFLQCIGVGIPSGMGAILFGISPFLAFVQRFVPRLLDGFLVGAIFRACEKKLGKWACFLAGFCTAFLNTAFFMSALVLLFGHTEYVQNLMNGRDVLAFIVGFVGVNAVVEMVSSTLIAGVVGTALYGAKILPLEKQ